MMLRGRGVNPGQRPTILTAMICLLGPTLAFAQAPTPTRTPNCRTPAPCNAPPTMSSVQISCAALNSHTFIANQLVEVDPAPTTTPCIIGDREISVSNVVLRGTSLVLLKPAGAGVDAFRISGDRVSIENFELRANGTTRFVDGVRIVAGADDVSLKNVTLDKATTNAGILVSGAARNACLYDTTVSGAPGTDSNGYTIEKPGAGGNIDIVLSTAESNGRDGFNVETGASPSRVTFLKAVAMDNMGDGYDIRGTTLEVLCSKSNANDSSDDDYANGIIVSDPSSSIVLDVENAYITDNEGVGIHGGNATLRVIASTLIGNDTHPNRTQIFANGARADVWNTIAIGNFFVDSDNSQIEWHCGFNLYSDNAGDCLPGRRATPTFLDGTQTYLDPASAGVDEGTDLRTPLPGLPPLRVAHAQDFNGTPRPRDGNQDGMSKFDMGAFELGPTPTAPPPPTGPPTRTSTRPKATRTARPSGTATRTRTPSQTPTPRPCTSPCPDPAPCLGDCDCNNAVSVNELVQGVNMALGKACPSACFDSRPADGEVRVGEILGAVRRALAVAGCACCGSSPEGGGLGGNGQTVTVDVGTASGMPGSSITVPISLSEGEGLVAGAQIDIVYDDAILSVGNPNVSCAVASRIEQSHLVVASLPNSPGVPAGKRRLRVIVYSGFSLISTLTDGDIASCTFTIGSSATAGQYNLLTDMASATDEDGDTFTTLAEFGWVQVCGGCGCP